MKSIKKLNEATENEVTSFYKFPENFFFTPKKTEVQFNWDTIMLNCENVMCLPVGKPSQTVNITRQDAVLTPTFPHASLVTMVTGQQVGICEYVRLGDGVLSGMAEVCVCVYDSLCRSKCVSESENWISLVTV